ncbi:MAG: S-methyl-5-thioribose-1-phosphate isomerase [Ignavibacteria bacterium]|jgi:methylthioribose-1-phosphate isomerase|nr:S-methyl-5-thioribose-1-phosphate isomerase [Ignavibacteria bacterium]MCU7505029.1 S-methyl-5-thioribose-1-phosphate isomerase [Ignavibacteria bacterium]MCU7515331.1 S-methyl-5-thioribose-1-phosphate isomerase [Ignavibacteria bacterium]
MAKTGIRAVEFIGDSLVYLDQTRLPLIEEYVKTDSYEVIAGAIERLEIRGAPAIGVAAAYALALSLKGKTQNPRETFEAARKRLASTRPTAVNLFWALNEISETFELNFGRSDLYTCLINKAGEIHQEDVEKCEAIARNGLEIFKPHSVVLTHCNAGALATGGSGTALNVIKAGFEHGLVDFVYSDETRPLFQGSRLTAFELKKYNVPFAMNTDSTAAFLMQQKKIDLVVTGADRIALNGDTANKIGTYNLAVLCAYHNIPFYIAAPETTVDRSCPEGGAIKIELRGKDELTCFKDVRITSDEYEAYCPAFDVTPSSLISGIITDKKLYKPPYNF